MAPDPAAMSVVYQAVIRAYATEVTVITTPTHAVYYYVLEPVETVRSSMSLTWLGVSDKCECDV